MAVKTPRTIVDVGDEPSFRRREVARSARLHGAGVLLALKGDEVLAVLEFYSRDKDHIDEVKPTLAAIGSELGEFFSRRRGGLAPPRLTPRELQILQLAALGNAAPQIAESLFISTSTVKTHMENIYRKLHVLDRAAGSARRRPTTGYQASTRGPTATCRRPESQRFTAETCIGP